MLRHATHPRGARASRPAGFTLVEMIVSLALTGIVLALVSSISLRQQRLVADLGDQRAVAERLREASVLLPVQLRAATPLDIRDARDTSLELRSMIASAVVCDTGSGILILASVNSNAPSYAAFAAPVEVGDSAWLFTNDASGEGWAGARVLAVGSHESSGCNALGPPNDSARANHVTLSVGALPPSPIGKPVRVTRVVRYSLYHASDNDWYLGEREWSDSAARFNSIQPVVGPLLSASNGGLRFQYADSTDTPLATPVINRQAIALIHIVLRAQTRNAMAIFAVQGPATRHTESALLTIALRNRQ